MGFSLRRNRRTPVRFHCTGWVFTVPSLWNLSGALGCCGKRPNPVCPQGRCHNAPLQAPIARYCRPKMSDGPIFRCRLRADGPVHAVDGMQRPAACCHFGGGAGDPGSGSYAGHRFRLRRPAARGGVHRVPGTWPPTTSIGSAGTNCARSSLRPTMTGWRSTRAATEPSHLPVWCAGADIAVRFGSDRSAASIPGIE